MSSKFLQYIILSVAILLASCTTTMIDVVSVQQHQEPINHLRIGTITLESIYTFTNDKQELKSVIISAGKKNGLIIDPYAQNTVSDQTHQIDFFLREKSYIKGFETITSNAIQADISTTEGTVLYRASYLYDGNESLTSMVFLHNALDEIFAALSQRTLYPEKQ